MTIDHWIVLYLAQDLDRLAAQDGARGQRRRENAGGDAPMGMEAEKEKQQVLQQQGSGDGDQARGASAAHPGAEHSAADVRAARKKLELVSDQPARMAKRLLTQDRAATTESADRPW